MSGISSQHDSANVPLITTSGGKCERSGPEDFNAIERILDGRRYPCDCQQRHIISELT